ncbi:uncharacterized protein V1518DRAFT_415284 [Limtongia smithiae]|uniref:uncharacterized protein n=1 Tax=Limtongia smithiae TaxID=1125753 RepID=UPI0034CFC917
MWPFDSVSKLAGAPAAVLPSQEQIVGMRDAVVAEGHAHPVRSLIWGPLAFVLGLGACAYFAYFVYRVVMAVLRTAGNRVGVSFSSPSSSTNDDTDASSSSAPSVTTTATSGAANAVDDGSTTRFRFSRTGANIAIRAIPQENYVDRSRSALYNAWLNSSAPAGYKAKYFKQRDEVPEGRHKYRSHRFRRWFGRDYVDMTPAEAIAERKKARRWRRDHGENASSSSSDEEKLS